MRNRRQRSELSDLIALAEHRHSMRALGRVAAASRGGNDGGPLRIAEVVDLDSERCRRRSNVLLLERPPDPA